MSERVATIRPSVRLLMFVLALVTVFLLIGGAASADTPAGPTTEYVVSSGDTLWKIAAGFTPQGGDVRESISLIKDLTGIKSSALMPGQILIVPLTG